MNELFKKRLDFIIEADKMKNIQRQTLLADSSRRENDAEHTFHFALAAMTFFDHCVIPGVDINRVVRMALVHDLVEIYAGDTYCYDVAASETQEEREKEAADKVFGMLPPEQGAEYLALWEEFDRRDTPDSKYAAAIDRIQPFINNTLTEGHTWKLGGVSVAQVYKRMAPIKEATPDLWEYVEENIKAAVEKGWIKP